VRFLVFFIFVFCLPFYGFSQIRNPFSDEILPLEDIGDFITVDGNFENYEATYGYIKHFSASYAALPFVIISQDSSLPFLFILNGGPGRSNLRLAFPVDSILKNYQICLPGYRGIDDGVIKRTMKLTNEEKLKFVKNHHTFLGSKSICEDFMLIANALKCDSVTIAAHSYGSILACELAKRFPQVVDSAIVFAPVDYNNPTISKIAIFELLNRASVAQFIDYNTFNDRMMELFHLSSDKLNFVFGIISYLYTFEGAMKLVREVNTKILDEPILVTAGKMFVKDEWLIDYGLKFYKIPLGNAKPKDLPEVISWYFTSGTQKYTIEKQDNSCLINNTLPIHFFLPRYELFHHFEIPAKTDTLDFGHADLWENAHVFLYK
jgi:hypothetical protein